MKVLFRLGFILIIIALMLVFTTIGLKLKNDLSADYEPLPVITETPAEEEPEQIEKTDSEAQRRYVETINSNMRNVSGDYQWGFKIYPSGSEHTFDSFKAPSASVIKVFVMEYAYNLIEDGKLSLDDVLSGSTVRNLLNAMITRSDNSATNVLIDEFGMERLNTFFAEKGYNDTKLERRMLDTQAMKAGRDNYTSVDDVMKFLDKLYENRESYPYSEMLSTMKKQQVRTKIPRLFPNDVIIANKTGELSNVENDIGIIFGEENDIAVVFLCSSLSSTSSARDAISNAAYDLYEAVETE